MDPTHARPLPRQLRLFPTTDYACTYLPEQLARNLVADPDAINQHTFEQLLQLGFRRSGEHIYRPHCAACHQCQSLRIPVDRFQPNRSQRRTWHHNQDLRMQSVRARFRREHYQLFERYVSSRHPNGGMDHTSPADYLGFIASTWSDTWVWEFRHHQELLCVAIVDQLSDGLSAVYTFFDPAHQSRSLGSYAILKQLQQARRHKLNWVYLGYWIQSCGKMSYKASFRPHQVYRDGSWRDAVTR